MAALTISIQNTLNVIGASKPSLWGDMVWLTDSWGNNSDIVVLFKKEVNNSVGVSITHAKSVSLNLPIETLGIDGNQSDLRLTDPAGMLYVFPSNTSNGANIASGIFTQNGIGSDDFSTFPIGSITSWSTFS